MASELNLDFLKRSRQEPEQEASPIEEPTPTGITSQFIIPKKRPGERQQREEILTKEQEALAKRGAAERVLLGIGSRIGDIGLGAAQTAGMLRNLLPGEPSALPQEVSEAVRAGAPYRAAIAGDPAASIGRAGVDIAASMLPLTTARLPAMVAGAALAGPLTPREEPTFGEMAYEAGKGALFGGLGAGVAGAGTQTLGKGLSFARGAVSDPEMARRLALSREHLVPLSLGDVTQYPGIKSIENTLALLPFNKRLPFLQEQADIMRSYAENLPESILRPMPIASKEDTGKALADSIKRQYGIEKATASRLYDDVATRVRSVGDPPVTPIGLRDTAIKLKSDYPDIFDAFQDKQAVSRLNSIIKGTGPRKTTILDAQGRPIEVAPEISFDDLRWLDKRLGGMIRQGRRQLFAGKMDPNAFEQVVALQGALRKDIDDWSTSIGQPEIADAWKTANAYFREKVVPFRETPIIKDVVQGKNVDTDKLPGRLFRPDSPTSVLQHKQFMTPEGIDAGRSFLLQDIRKKTLDPAAEAGYSPKAFLRAADLGETGPKMFSPNELEELGGIGELMRITSRAAEPLDIGSYRALSTVLGRAPMVPMIGRGITNMLQSPAFTRFVVAPSEIAPGGLGRMIEQAARRSGMGAGLEAIRTEEADFERKGGGLVSYAKGGRTRPTRVPLDLANREAQELEARRILEGLRGFTGAPSRETVMLPGGTEAYGAGETAGLLGSLTDILPGTAAAKGLGGLALAGAIRRGGDPSLLAVHNLTASPDEIMSLLTGRRSISSPSVAISRKPFPFQESPTLLFNPSSPLLDPKFNLSNQLFNRDAYTLRKRMLPTEFRTRGPIDVRLTEEANAPMSQSFALMARPRFRSFSEYERSPAGAATLIPSFGEEAKKLSDDILDDRIRWFDENMERIEAGEFGPYINQTQLLRNAARQDDTEAISILRRAQQIPSEYAELKVAGEIPIQPRDVSAVIIPESYASLPTFSDDISHIESATGVRAGTPRMLATEDLLQRYGEKLDPMSDKFIADVARELTSGRAKGGLVRYKKR